MKSFALAALALTLSAPALAQSQPPPPPPPASANGAIAGGKVSAFDPGKKTIVVDANGQKIEINIGGAAVAGQIAVGKMVDITYANGKASAISVRPDGSAPQGTQSAQSTQSNQTMSASGGTASAPGAIAGGKVTAFDAARKVIVLDANGQKVEINIANAMVAGQIAVGKMVDITYANGVASAVAVRP